MLARPLISAAARVLCVISAALSGLASAQQFSAELVDLQKPGTPAVARFYFNGQMRRIEMLDASGDDAVVVPLVRPTANKRGTHIGVGGRGLTVIMNLGGGTSAVLFPADNSYSEKIEPAELYALYASMHANNVDNACAEWMQAPAAATETCRKLGPEKVDGRDSVGYELSCYGELCRLWVDRELHVLIKRETKWNSSELRNVHEGSQPARLFQIPDGYAPKKVGGIIRPTLPQ